MSAASQTMVAPSTVGSGSTVLRAVAWANVALTLVFLVNNFLNFWMRWPGALPTLGFGPAYGNAPPLLGWLQVASFALAVVLPIVYAVLSRDALLRRDAERLYRFTAYLIRGAFWAVLFVGLADMAISFMRIEGLMEPLVGAQLTQDLGRSQFRGPNVHMPLILLGFVVALFTRTLGFTWLALLVVLAELQIVIARFVFSYEQAFMSDLVRFWYAALFLFASAYTLIEEGHVRVDVFYARFSRRERGVVNSIGSLLLGMSLCWVVIVIGLQSSTSIINAAILNYETTQSGFGMYVKYLMAGFLAVFATTMSIQFSGYLLSALADIRGEPGGRALEEGAVH